MTLKKSRSVMSIMLTIILVMSCSNMLVFSQNQDTILNNSVDMTTNQSNTENLANQISNGGESNRFIIKYKKSSSEPKANVEKKIKTKLKNKFKKIKSMKKKDYAIVEINESEKYSDVISDLGLNQQDSDIEYIQPDYRISSVYGDTYSDEQWGLMDNNLNCSQYTFGTNSTAAWNASMGDGVTIAVIDTGVDINHEGLSQNIWINKNEIANNGADDDGNGYIDDINGYDFYDKTNQVYDANKINNEMHGTHVGGIIGAVKKSEAGTSGVAPKVKIMPLKVFGDGQAYTSDIIDAIAYAEQNGARIVNCSWGTTQYNQALKDVISASNMLFVCAAGNSGTNIDANPVYPASYDCPNIISVASINKNGNLSSFSNYGEKSVDVAAPGEDILSTLPNNTYGIMSGTSMSAGFVTGEIALIESKYKNLSNAEVKRRLMDSSDILTSLVGKVNSGNKINCNNALNDNYINYKAFSPNVDGVNNWVCNSVDSSVYGSVYDSVDSSVYGSVYSSVYQSEDKFNLFSGTYMAQLKASLVNALTIKQWTTLINYTGPDSLTLYGDLNGDNIVNSVDYAYMNRYIGGTISSFPNSDGLAVADLNGDRIIDSSDQALMNNFLLHSITSFPISLDFSKQISNLLESVLSGGPNRYNVIQSSYSIFGTSGNYSITFDFVYPDDYRNTIDASTQIINGSVSGKVEYAKDVDFFKYVPAVSGTYYLGIVGANICGTLYDSNYSQIGTYNNTGMLYNFIANKTYYIKISNSDNLSTGSYLLKIIPNSVVKCSTSCVTGTTFNLVLRGNNIQDMSKYTFTITYNPADFEIVDMCALTDKKDVFSEGASGIIEGTNLTVTQYSPSTGVIKIKLNKSITSGKDWSGIVDIIKLKAKNSNVKNISITSI